MPANRRQEYFQVGTRYQFREHAAGIFKQRTAQFIFINIHALGDTGQIPHRINRRLGHTHIAVFFQDDAIRFQAARAHGVMDFRDIDMRLGHGNRRAHIHALFAIGGEHIARDMPPRIKTDNAVRISPLRMRADFLGRRSIMKIGHMQRIKHADGHRHRTVN